MLPGGQSAIFRGDFTRWTLTKRFTIQMIREGIIEMKMSGSYDPGYRSLPAIRAARCVST